MYITKHHQTYIEFMCNSHHQPAMSAMSMDFIQRQAISAVSAKRRRAMAASSTNARSKKAAGGSASADARVVQCAGEPIQTHGVVLVILVRQSLMMRRIIMLNRRSPRGSPGLVPLVVQQTSCREETRKKVWLTVSRTRCCRCGVAPSIALSSLVANSHSLISWSGTSSLRNAWMSAVESCGRSISDWRRTE